MQSVRTVIGTLFARRLANDTAIQQIPSSINNQRKFFLHTKTTTKMAHFLAGEKLVVNRKGDKVSADEFLKDKVVALYFSAMWCPPCRAFTPKLKKFYEELKKEGKNFEVVFVSRDRTLEDLKEYYNDHQPEWAYLEFGNPKINELLEKYEVKTIPTLRVVKPDGKVVVQEARNEVAEKGQKAKVLFDDWMAYYDI